MKQIISKCVVVAITLALAAGAFMPVPAVSARGQNTPELVLSVPSIWQDTLTQDLLATFESQYNVNVVVTYNNTSFFGFGGPNSSISDALDNTQTNVTSADVLYVDSNSLTAADTQAGYYLDLMPLVNSDPDINTNDFIPAVWQSYQWDNGMWALPLSTDVILLTYDQTAFDNAGLAYPNERWTIDDFANAAKALTQYNADGTVNIPGFTTLSGGNNLNVFLRALAGNGFYDPSTMPNAPSFSSNTTLEHVLDVGYQMIQDSTVSSQGGGFDNNIPLRVEGINGYAQRGFRGNNNNNNQNQTETRYAALLPGGVAGLNTTGFAVSAGTSSPELAYDLAKFLTSLPELANNAFSAVPARYSLEGTQATTNNNNGNGNGGPGGGPGGGFFANRTIPDTIQPTVDQGLKAGLPTSELRYASYVAGALDTMSSNGGDALSALQSAEALAMSDTQTAEARAGTVQLFVTPPPSGPTVEPGQVALNCAVNLGFGGGPFGRSQLPNQDEWNNIIANFVPNDPEIGAVVLTPTNETDLATLAQNYDCFILPSNAVTGSDVSPLLNLDPLIDSDPNFDRNDVIGNTLSQLQQNNMTYALPLAIEPQMLEYDPQKFADAGVPDPTNGWTPEAFTDALKTLKPYDTDPTPFVPNDPSGSYLMMLIAAYGGLPIDYRTDPPTINFSDPTTEAAIQQVLDLAKNGYIAYSPLVGGGGGFSVQANDSSTAAITTNTLNRFRRFAPNAPNNQPTMVQTMYPQGSQYGAVAYQITTGYISATAQNPEGAYRFLSTVARNPQLFSGMPARQSLVNDPTVEAALGQDMTAIYQQLDTLLRSPNTIIFPTFTEGRGGGPLSFLQTYWLQQAFDDYVNNGADLDTALTNAQQITTAYLECAANVVVDTSAATGNNPGGGRFQALGQCATTADPTFSFGGGD